MSDMWNGQLFEHSRAELIDESAISEAVVLARGYRSIGRPSSADNRPREELQRLGIPSWATAEDYYFPGLLIPMWDPTGHRASYQFKPRLPVANRDGRKMKYAAVKNQPSVLDVHPMWTQDRGRDDPALVPYIRDIDRPLFITEGVKKADSLTSRGCCTVALSGVFNWRNSQGTLGAWEDVPLKGRQVRVVFDADARTKPGVLRAMVRLGRWLKSKQVADVLYVIPPAQWKGVETKGADDFFAAGATLENLMSFATTTPPVSVDTDATFSDATMVEVVAEEVLGDRVTWAERLGWLRFDGRAWRETSEPSVGEDVRAWAAQRFAEAAARMAAAGNLLASDANEITGWQGMLSATRRSRLVQDVRGHIEVPWDQFDCEPAMFNTLSGVLDLDTGICRPALPSDWLTKTAGAGFDGGARSPLWETFVARVLPDPEVRNFVQRLIGYSMLGVVREHVLPILTGTGANGKGTLRDALLGAFGDYATEIDPEMLMSSHHSRHGTFKMRLRGQRLVFASETEENRAFANATMKRLTGGDPIEANRMHRDPIVFKPSHTLVMVTNHLPNLPGDDEASWRRVRVVPFDTVIAESERDGTLPEKLAEPHVRSAILAWAYTGFLAYREIGLAAPGAVLARTGDYRTANDPLGRFIAERLEFGHACRVTSTDLYRAYEAWCRSEGEEYLTKTAFGKAMGRIGYESVKTNGTMVYRGVMLVNMEGDEHAA